MRILALDLGQSTGWAVNGKLATQHGVASFEWPCEWGLGRRLWAFETWLEAKLLAAFHEAIVYEAPHHRGGPATRQLLGFAALVELHAAKNGSDCFSVHTATLKKYATGKGNTKGKVEMIAYASRLVGEPITDDNEADAICLLDYAFSLDAIPCTR